MEQYQRPESVGLNQRQYPTVSHCRPKILTGSLQRPILRADIDLHTVPSSKIWGHIPQGDTVWISESDIPHKGVPSPLPAETYPTRGYRPHLRRGHRSAYRLSLRSRHKKTAPGFPGAVAMRVWGATPYSLLLLLQSLVRRPWCRCRLPGSGSGHGRPDPGFPCSGPGKSGCR